MKKLYCISTSLQMFIVVCLSVASMVLLTQSTQASSRHLQFLDTVQCDSVVTGNHSGHNGTSHNMVYDNELSTYFESSHDNWQYIQIDFNCVQLFKAFRRYMSPNGNLYNTDGSRSFQGEGVAYSVDGVNWISLTGTTAHGWESYVNYGTQRNAWHTVKYGWSEWLQLDTPVSVRYIRFNWDGNFDTLHEIELKLEEESLNQSRDKLQLEAIASDLPDNFFGLQVEDAFALTPTESEIDYLVLPGAFEIEFPGEQVIKLKVKELSPTGRSGVYEATSFPELQDAVAYFTVEPQAVSGFINGFDNTYIFTGPDLNKLHVYVIDPRSFPPEYDGSISEENGSSEEVVPPEQPMGETVSELGSVQSLLEASTIQEIDLLVVYTPAAAKQATAAFSTITAMVNNAVNQANDAYNNSAMLQRLIVVGIEQVDYIETGDHGNHLNRLNSTDDGIMDEIHRWRDRLGADLVVMIVDDSSNGGKANLHSVSGNADDDDAFAVVHVGSLAYFTLAHEIGHIGGAHHDWGADPWPIPMYAHGLVNEDGGWRTVMAYDQCEDFNAKCPRIPHFSNPNIQWTDGRNTGQGSRSDNHRRLNETASTLARFRIRGPRVSFYEGNYAIQDHVCVIALDTAGQIHFDGTGDNRWCDNDEARSLALYDVSAGTVLRLFDSPVGAHTDDWIEIRVLKNIKEYVLPSFEKTFADSFVEVAYHRTNGLDGKISFVEVSSGGSGALVDLFEGNNGSQDRLCTLFLEQRTQFSLGGNSGCSNDEARSLHIFNGRAGQVLRLYDSPSGSLDDDWTHIEILVDTFFIEVESLEKSFSNASVKVEHHHKNGLNGKVSFVEIIGNGGDRRIELYEGSNLTQNRICIIPAGQRRVLNLNYDSSCSNDEAKSALIRGLSPGQVVLFFDSPNGSREDDWTAVEILRKGDIFLNNFEETFDSPLARVVFFRNNGLNGKISRIEVHDSFNIGGILSLYEGYNAAQNKVCDISLRNQVIDFKSSSACDNDEARSAVLTLAPAGTRIQLFDDPDCETNDDWLSIELLDDVLRYTIGNLESSFSNSSVRVVYHRDNGLNGKVSCIKIASP